MGHKGREGKYDFIIALGPETSNKEALAKWEKVSGQITRLSEQEKKQADLATHKKAQRVVEASGNRTNWIVTGTYKIKCPVIEKDYGEDDRSITIFAEKGQLFAKFNMGIIEGYMRLERHAKDIPTSGGGADTGTTAKKRKRAEFEDEDIPYDPYDSDRRSPTPEEFHLGKVTMPSPEYPSWDYRWRGTDTGCGEHQIDSEKKFYKMTFLEPLGMTIEGTFGSEYHKDCSFMAHKIATGKPYDGNISEAWAELSEDAISYR
ncbi:hypothetical protein BKA65DRAFT_407743 [Rhexocercosporidium sp. MPI-PUGE-AT-0058]|nr:hypothetical protein BKA65DRAFT_407743 [Rhexocercosporidium sp. MPI-PUGE-AT-0058]